MGTFDAKRETPDGGGRGRSDLETAETPLENHRPPYSLVSYWVGLGRPEAPRQRPLLALSAPS
ncbi:MAG: uncharacterized protein KVP18_001840 [Porospora cf. gigantea A]|uniref:uncharacterized protein n=1 Tax=Porospora cf. gigantea A TaxID=2853593 RepID=UPI003559979C|nr:MAG: hypothetical protein KVP18_001840 [Porospora cf. gigantea A]